MKIRPTLKEVEELAAEGKYKTVPLSCEILSDFITPIEAMRILKNVSSLREPAGRLKGPVTPLFDRKRYCDMVERAKAHIREGDIFQIVLSNRLSAPFEGSLLNAYRVLRTINPSPYMFYLSGTDVEVAGVEREYFLAGGLDARNVRAAIRRLSPYAVDVSSGIESDGIKDEKKMAAFVAAVRQENDIT